MIHINNLITICGTVLWREKSSCIKSKFTGPLVGAASTVEREAVHQVRVSSINVSFLKTKSILCPIKVREVDTGALLSANYIVFVVLLATCALVVILVVTGLVSRLVNY